MVSPGALRAAKPSSHGRCCTHCAGLTPGESGSLAQEATPAAQESPSGPAHLEGDLPGDPQVQLIQIATGLQTPTNIAFPPDDSGRIFVVEETGTIHIVNSDGSVEPEPFLDLSNTVSQRPGQQGLMGLAFHPDFATQSSALCRLQQSVREWGDHGLRVSDRQGQSEQGRYQNRAAAADDRQALPAAQRGHAPLWPGRLSLHLDRRWRLARRPVRQRPESLLAPGQDLADRCRRRGARDAVRHPRGQPVRGSRSLRQPLSRSTGGHTSH